jgi:hypothetical protein
MREGRNNAAPRIFPIADRCCAVDQQAHAARIAGLRESVDLWERAEFSVELNI